MCKHFSLLFKVTANLFLIRYVAQIHNHIFQYYKLHLNYIFQPDFFATNIVPSPQMAEYLIYSVIIIV